MSALGDLNDWKQTQMSNSKTIEEQEKIIKLYKERRSSLLYNWKRHNPPSIRINHEGYVMIKVNQKWIPEHRYVWEQAHGPLPKGWIVHHLNGKRDDNRLENLLGIPRNKHKTTFIQEANLKRIIELEDQVNQLDGIITELMSLVEKNNGT